MTDRQPGAPGQYIMTINPAVSQKLLIGEPVEVVLKRDDMPVVEGTPYNKASVLPDDLSSKICPAVADPTPADAYRGLLGSSSQAILFSGAWSNNQQRVAFPGATATNNVFVSPEPSTENYEEYTSCGVRCIAQTNGYLTFFCESVPGIDVVANVLVRP
jgi:hypothetical protein